MCSEKYSNEYLSEEAKSLNNVNEEPQKDALESVLHYVGEMGRYQWLLFLGMCPFGVAYAFVYFTQMFIVATPQDYWCHVPELAGMDPVLRRSLTIPENMTSFDRCMTYDTNWTAVLETGRRPDANTGLVMCTTGWEFNLTDIPYATVVSERGWVCQYSSKVPTAQAAFFAGSLIGGLFIGWLADSRGRIPALVAANGIGFLGSVATVFTTSFWDFVIARFFVGMSYDSCMMMIYILVLEYVGPNQRTWVANVSIALYFGGGCIALPWIAYFIADWRMLTWVTAAPMVTVVLVPFIVPESARWLASKGKVKKAVQVLRRFEKVNGTKVPDNVMEEFIISSKHKKKCDETMLDLFKNPSLRLMMFAMIVAYMSCSIVFDGLVRLSENLGLDFFLTFTLTSATEVPSVLLLAVILDRWGRRWLTCAPMAVAGVLSLIAAIVPIGIPQVGLAIMARFFINMAYNAAIQWATELLPTGLRATGSSLVHVSGYLATMLSPFIVFSESIWHPLPLLIIGIISLVGGGTGIILPETRGIQMPQTIADGEKIFNENSFCGKSSDKHDFANNYEFKNEIKV